VLFAMLERTSHKTTRQHKCFWTTTKQRQNLAVPQTTGPLSTVPSHYYSSGSSIWRVSYVLGLHDNCLSTRYK